MHACTHIDLLIYNNNNIFSLIKRLTNALRCTFTCYAIETILTTNRTDSLQYTALIAAYKACPPYGTRIRYLSLSTPVCYPMRYQAPQMSVAVASFFLTNANLFVQ